VSAAEDFEKFKKFFTDEFSLDGEKLEKAIHNAMSAKGHKPVMAWKDAEPDDGDKGDDNPFSSGKRKRAVEGAKDPNGKGDSGSGFFGLGD